MRSLESRLANHRGKGHALRRNQLRQEGALLLNRFHAPGRTDPELQRREATVDNVNLVEGHDQVEVLP
jgi:hypothetical protein